MWFWVSLPICRRLMGMSRAVWGRQQLDGRKILLSPVLQAFMLKRWHLFMRGSGKEGAMQPLIVNKRTLS